MKVKNNHGFREIMARIEAAEEKRRINFEDNWQKYYHIFRFQAQEIRDGSNIYTPYTFMQCAVIQARLRDSLFSNRPFVSVLPLEGNDSEQAELLQNLLDWQLNERIGLKRVIGNDLLQSLIVYGTAICYTGWQLQKRKIKRPFYQQQQLQDEQGIIYDEQNGQPYSIAKRQIIESDTVVYDDPFIKNIDLFDFFVDPIAANINDARYCGHTEYQTRAQLEKMVAENNYQIDFSKLEPVADPETASRKKHNMANYEQENEYGQGALYLVHHYWQDDRHAVIINRKIMALDEPNPFWHGLKPYDKCCYQNLNGEFYGMGVPEMCQQLQDELNTNRNQRIDYNSMTLRRMWKVRRGSGISQNDLKWRQNGIIQIADMNDIAEINVQQLPAAAFASEEAIKQDMRDVTGCHDIVMGLSNSKETATSTRTKDSNASLRFHDISLAVEEGILLPIAHKCVALNQQFLTAERIIRVVGDKQGGQLLTINPLILGGSYDIVYCGSAIDGMANRELQRERLLQAYALLAKDSLYSQDEQARINFMELLLEALEIKGAEKILPQIELGQDNNNHNLLPSTADLAAPKAALPDNNQQLNMLIADLMRLSKH